MIFRKHPEKLFIKLTVTCERIMNIDGTRRVIIISGCITYVNSCGAVGEKPGEKNSCRGINCGSVNGWSYATRQIDEWFIDHFNHENLL